MKLAIAVISFIMIRFEVLVIIMVIYSIEATFFVLFCVDNVHFHVYTTLKALPGIAM